jgi:AcrR family transcriptional regulator
MDDSHSTDGELGGALPPGLALLWGAGRSSRRGPKPGLSVEAVVGAAVDIADAEGIAAVSMARVAKRLGFTTMSLYRYVSSKDALVDLMIDTVVAEPTQPDSGEAWRPALERWAWEYLAALRRHPWIVQVPVSAPPLGPRSLLWLEAGLMALSGTPLDEGEKVGIVLLVTGFVRSEARLWGELEAAAGAAAGSEDPDRADADSPEGAAEVAEMPSYGGLLRALIDERAYPALMQVVDSGAFDGPQEYSEEDVRFGLDRILDGVAALVAGRDTGG